MYEIASLYAVVHNSLNWKSIYKHLKRYRLVKLNFAIFSPCFVKNNTNLINKKEIITTKLKY